MMKCRLIKGVISSIIDSTTHNGCQPGMYQRWLGQETAQQTDGLLTEWCAVNPGPHLRCHIHREPLLILIANTGFHIHRLILIRSFLYGYALHMLSRLSQFFSRAKGTLQLMCHRLQQKNSYDQCFRIYRLMCGSNSNKLEGIIGLALRQSSFSYAGLSDVFPQRGEIIKGKYIARHPHNAVSDVTQTIG